MAEGVVDFASGWISGAVSIACTQVCGCWLLFAVFRVGNRLRAVI